MDQLVNIGELLGTLILIGFLTETVVEILKTYVFSTTKRAEYLFLVSLIIGFLLVFALQVSLFEPDNVVAYYVGMVICGLVASRGSNYVHNWLGNIPAKRVFIEK